MLEIKRLIQYGQLKPSELGAEGKAAAACCAVGFVSGPCVFDPFSSLLAKSQAPTGDGTLDFYWQNTFHPR